MHFMAMAAYDGNRILGVDAASLADDSISDDHSNLQNTEAQLGWFEPGLSTCVAYVLGPHLVMDIVIWRPAEQKYQAQVTYFGIATHESLTKSLGLTRCAISRTCS